MFTCQLGKHNTALNEKLVKVVLKTRVKTYPEEKRLWRGQTFYDKGGTGSETVLEVSACALHAVNVAKDDNGTT